MERSCAKETRRKRRESRDGRGKGGRQARQRKESRKEEYYTRSKFISGHPGGRNRRGQIPSRASPSSFAKPVRNLHPRRRPSLPPRWLGWLYPPFDWRDKSLRLTGSRRITGTGDIYASSPTDRGITRNKEIANLLRAHPSFSFPVRDSRPTPSPSSLL